MGFTLFTVCDIENGLVEILDFPIENCDFPQLQVDPQLPQKILKKAGVQDEGRQTYCYQLSVTTTVEKQKQELTGEIQQLNEHRLTKVKVGLNNLDTVRTKDPGWW